MGEGEDNSLFGKLVQSTDKINAGDPSYMVPDALMGKFQGMLEAALREKGIGEDQLRQMVAAATRMSSSVPITSGGSLARFVAEIVSRQRR